MWKKRDIVSYVMTGLKKHKPFKQSWIMKKPCHCIYVHIHSQNNIRNTQIDYLKTYIYVHIHITTVALVLSKRFL